MNEPAMTITYHDTDATASVTVGGNQVGVMQFLSAEWLRHFRYLLDIATTARPRGATRFRVRADDDDRGHQWLDKDGEFRFDECDGVVFTSAEEAVTAAFVNYPPALSADVEWVLVPVWEVPTRSEQIFPCRP